MKIALLCHGTVLLPAIEAIGSQNLLVGIAVPDIMPAVNYSIRGAAEHFGVPFEEIAEDTLADQLKAWLRELLPDVVCMMGFPYKIPAGALDFPRYGFFNLHGGKLPDYAGPDPIFWQLKNQEREGEITIHRVENKMDAGPVAHIERLPLGPCDTYGIVLQRMGSVLPRALIAFVQQLAIHKENIPLVAQNKSKSVFSKRPQEADQTIDWSWPAGAIDALVRACNPVFLGALTAFKNTAVRILQTTSGKGRSDAQSPPGTILQIEETGGIEVACGRQQSLILDIVCIESGIFSGGQMAKLYGLHVGDAFRPGIG